MEKTLIYFKHKIKYRHFLFFLNIFTNKQVNHIQIDGQRQF